MITHEHPLFERQEYVDGEHADGQKHEFFQFKYDGIWSKLVKAAAGPEVIVYSRNNKIKTKLMLPEFPAETVLFAEYMFGSQWAQRADRKGKFFVFDCPCFGGNILKDTPYAQRLKAAKAVSDNLYHMGIHLIESYPAHYFRAAWERLEKERHYEGVVLRNFNQKLTDKLVRLKLDVNDDYFITEFHEGQGRLTGTLGAISVSKFSIDGQVIPVMTVGGGFSDALRNEIWNNKAKYFNAVVEITGKARFASGALRHPNFVRFREDKTRDQCVEIKNNE